MFVLFVPFYVLHKNYESTSTFSNDPSITTVAAIPRTIRHQLTAVQALLRGSVVIVLEFLLALFASPRR